MQSNNMHVLPFLNHNRPNSLKEQKPQILSPKMHVGAGVGGGGESLEALVAFLNAFRPN